MEKNTVCLSLEDYEVLKDFRDNILAGNMYTTTGHSCSPYKHWYTNDEAIKELSDKVSELSDKIRDKEWEYNVTLRELRSKEYEEAKNNLKAQQEAYSKIKKMSILQFIKWYKSK